jgi:hypothetical protein
MVLLAVLRIVNGDMQGQSAMSNQLVRINLTYLELAISWNLFLQKKLKGIQEILVDKLVLESLKFMGNQWHIIRE